jgi:hypothetical protein
MSFLDSTPRVDAAKLEPIAPLKAAQEKVSSYTCIKHIYEVHRIQHMEYRVAL